MVEEYNVKELELISFKKRIYVRRITRNAISKGVLIRPKNCDLCKCAAKIEAHHVDYGNPLEITWLCKKCHHDVHQPEHPLNPKNNPQTAMPYIVNEYKNISITFEVPIKNYLAMNNQAEIQNKTVSQLMRESAESLFPVLKQQLEFNLENKNDNSQNVPNQRVQSLEKDEGLRKQSERSILPTLRRKRNNNMRGMEKRLFEIHGGHGENARKLQRTSSN